MKKEKQKKFMVIGILAVILVIFALITLQFGMPLVELANEPQKFRGWLDEQGIFSALYMIGIIFLQITIAFIPGEPFEIGAGYAFGFWEGTLLCLVGSAFASALIMLLVRRYGKRLIHVFFSEEKIEELWFLKDQKKLNFWTFIAFFIPGSPKDVMTYALGLTNMKVTTFVFISTLARIPSIITSTFSGNALGEENYLIAIASFVFTLIISALGLWYYTRMMKRKKRARDYS